ncbi:hypothetical protein F2Q70_00019487 [Brassica cretica]|uniref:Uncharacterized protein n=1 Tax=Brassica cretica TaxID=69181 RepID=A0A8S9GPT5_BRACR|nr:hypothetical protein F2Q70_00019487 [Brassica cretica]KAF2554659.1 hypothetical protein F2Q68_00012954 [Brassica cretica]
MPLSNILAIGLKDEKINLMAGWVKRGKAGVKWGDLVKRNVVRVGVSFNRCGTVVAGLMWWRSRRRLKNRQHPHFSYHTSPNQKTWIVSSSDRRRKMAAVAIHLKRNQMDLSKSITQGLK